MSITTPPDLITIMHPWCSENHTVLPIILHPKPTKFWNNQIAILIKYKFIKSKTRIEKEFGTPSTNSLVYKVLFRKAKCSVCASKTVCFQCLMVRTLLRESQSLKPWHSKLLWEHPVNTLVLQWFAPDKRRNQHYRNNNATGDTTNKHKK